MLVWLRGGCSSEYEVDVTDEGSASDCWWVSVHRRVSPFSPCVHLFVFRLFKRNRGTLYDLAVFARVNKRMFQNGMFPLYIYCIFSERKVTHKWIVKHFFSNGDKIYGFFTFIGLHYWPQQVVYNVWNMISFNGLPIKSIICRYFDLRIYFWSFGATKRIKLVTTLVDHPASARDG